MIMNQPQLDENLIGYLLGALDEATTAHVEAHLQVDPEARRRLNQLQGMVEPLATDKADNAPPKDLTVRTLARVAEYCSLDLTRAPQVFARFGAQRSRWRRADVAVAAAIVLLALLLGVPTLLHMRSPGMGAALAGCQNNLREFGVGLQMFKDQHHQFPSVVVEKPRDAAGMVVPILASAGVKQDAANLLCPGSGFTDACSMSLEQARALDLDLFSQQAGHLVPSYAYSLGYRDKSGNYFGPMVPVGLQASDFPIMADSPPADGGMGNSDNHAGAGQNVLFADGHVRFVSLRTIGLQGDDIYRNKANQVAAGLDPCDPVLGSSAAKP
jgi:prepilin-type processing-associated H-X9-DG protein